MTVTLDRMIHTVASHTQMGKSIGLEECRSSGCHEKDLSPIDLLAMSLASCLMLVMAKGACKLGLDLTGTRAETDYDLTDYKVRTITVRIHSPQTPSPADRQFMETESHTCPVYLAIKDNVSVQVTFEWGSKPALAK